MAQCYQGVEGIHQIISISKWANALGFVSEEPKIVMLNPGRRKRYVAHEGPLDVTSIGTYTYH